jgi:hypothetical protein
LTFTHVALHIQASSVLHHEDQSVRLRAFSHGGEPSLRLSIRNDHEFAWFDLGGIDPVRPLRIEDAIRNDWYEVFPPK